MDVTFVERGSAGDWAMDVLQGGEKVGTIVRNAERRLYLYFHGPTREVYLMDDRDLLLLKERVARRLISAAKREWSRLLLPAGARVHPALRKRA